MSEFWCLVIDNFSLLLSALLIFIMITDLTLISLPPFVVIGVSSIIVLSVYSALLLATKPLPFRKAEV